MADSETFDFVIVGSGGGGLAGALAAAAAGASVVVLEKTDLIGGSTAMSGGVLWIPNSQPANSPESPWNEWILSAATSQASAARSSAVTAASPGGRVPNQTSSRPAWSR